MATSPVPPWPLWQALMIAASIGYMLRNRPTTAQIGKRQVRGDTIQPDLRRQLWPAGESCEVGADEGLLGEDQRVVEVAHQVQEVGAETLLKALYQCRDRRQRSAHRLL